MPKKVLKLYPFVSPTFQRLDERQRSQVLSSFEREFNLAKFVQGEASPRLLKEHERSRQLFTTTAGFDQSHTLAITRLCLLFRCASPAEGDLLNHVFSQLAHDEKVSLQSELLATGFDGDPASLLYYAPATMDVIKKRTTDRSHAYAFGMSLLHAVFKAARAHQNQLRAHGGVMQVRMDSVANSLRELKDFPHAPVVEIYEDPSYGVSARLKLDPCKVDLTASHGSPKKAG